MASRDSAVIDSMVAYLADVIEKPHPAFGGMPICPFSRQARLANQILYCIYPFSCADLTTKTPLLQIIDDFQQSPQYEILLVIHPDYSGLSLDATHQFMQQLNQAIAAQNLIAFDGHPQDDFNIQGVYTRKAPFIHLTVQHLSKVKAASDQLHHTPYYKSWTAEQLSYVGLPRE